MEAPVAGVLTVLSHRMIAQSRCHIRTSRQISLAADFLSCVGSAPHRCTIGVRYVRDVAARLQGISFVSGLDYFKGLNECYAAKKGVRLLMPPNPRIVMASVDCDIYASSAWSTRHACHITDTCSELCWRCPQSPGRLCCGLFSPCALTATAAPCSVDEGAPQF